MADLPRFGEARQAGAKAKFLLLQNADAPSLLASARAALERLKAAHPQLAPLLTKRGAKLLDENALDFERATLDAEQRKKHDGRVNAFIRTLAPCCASRDGLAVLEALVQTSDATSCAGDALLRALAPHCHAAPAAKIAFKAAATASHDSLAQRWRWARDVNTETQNVGFAAHCAADTALAEDLADSTIVQIVQDCRDAVSEGGDAKAVADVYAPIVAFGAACLSTALASSRSKKLARRLLPVLSKVFDDDKGDVQARQAAAACLLAAATHGALTSSAIDAASKAILLRVDAGPRELGVALTLCASKKGDDGKLPDGVLQAFLQTEQASTTINALASDRFSCAAMLAPQLVPLACGGSDLATSLLASFDGHAPRIVAALANEAPRASRDALLEEYVRQCDANDVPESLLEGGTTASLIALRLSRGQVNALDDAAKLASASARDIDRDAPLASALIKALPASLDAISSHQSLQDILVDAADADASLVAHASSKAMRVVCARRSTNHFRAGDTERALVCAEACLSGEDASEVMEACEAPALFLCVARGDAQGAAGFLDDLAAQCASRLAACTVWAPAVAAYLTTTKDEATARHASAALSNGSADDCLEAALRVLSKEESIPFCLARLEAEVETPLTVIEVCFADATEAARAAAGACKGLRGALDALSTVDQTAAAPLLVGLAHADAPTRLSATRKAVDCDAISSLVKGREAAIADDRETIRRAVRSSLKNGQLEEIMDEDMLSCWSCDAGDRKLALALLEAFSQSLPWSASASTALDAVLGTDQAKPPAKKKRRSLTNSRTSPKKTAQVKTTLGSEKCATYLLAAFLQACADDEVADEDQERIESRCLAALSMDCAEVAVRFLPRLSLGDSERSRLFAALLGLLKRDDLQVKRTDVQAACSAIANKNDWPRAWAAALRRSDIAGFCGDADALLDASSSQSSCRPLCAAIKRLAPAAPPKKQYLLDRIATSDGFQEGKEDTSFTLKRLLTALEDALTSHADVAGVGAADADVLARIGTDDALRALAALLERCACDGAWEGWLQAARNGDAATASRIARASIRGYERPPLLVVAAASSDNDDDGALLAACASALDDEGDGKGIAAVVLGLLQRQRDRAAENVLRRTDRESQIDALGHLARCSRPLVQAALDDELMEEACLPLVRVRDVCNRRGASLALAAVVAGFCRRRVFALQKETPHQTTGKKRRRRPGQGRKKAQIVESNPQQQRRRLALCQALSAALASLPYGVAAEEARPRAYSTASRLEAEDQSPIGGDECSQQSFAACARAYARALRRSLGLVDAPGLLSFLERALSVNQPRHVREAALEALAERLDAQPLYDDQSKPSALARVLLEETLPRVAQAIKSDVDDSDEDSKHAAVVATRCADVLARGLATPLAPPSAKQAFTSVLESASLAAEANVDTSERCAACFRLLQTLFATLREASLPALPVALPKFVAGCASALRKPGRVHVELRRAALDALVVLSAAVPQFLHPHLDSILDIIVEVEAKRSSSQTSVDLLVQPALDSDDEDDLNGDEARTARRVARALASGVEPRLLVPAYVSCTGRAWASSTDGAPAAALRLTKVCVEKCGRGAAKAHAAQIATLALGSHDACSRLNDKASVESACVELSLALLAKLSEGELVDWLRAAEHWAAAAPDGSLPSKDGSLVASPIDEDASSRRRAYAALHLATLAKRFRQLAAPRIADSSLERLARDVQGGAGSSTTKRLLAARSASAIAEVVSHLPEKLDADRCDCCVEGLVAALTHSADVWPDRASFLRHASKALSPACAAVAERVQDVPKRRDFALKLMLLARDGTVGTRRASLNAVRAICDALREDVADFANQLVQGVAEALDDAETAADARAVVVLVEQHTGIRLV